MLPELDKIKDFNFLIIVYFLPLETIKLFESFVCQPVPRGIVAFQKNISK